MFESLTKAWRNFWKKIRTEKIERLKPDDLKYKEDDSERVKELKRKIKALEQQRGYAKGEEASQTVKAKQYENLVARKKTVNISKAANEKSKEIGNRAFKGGFSFQKLFLTTTKSKKKDIKVYSYNMKRYFGIFHDFGILNDGRVVLYIKTNNQVVPLLTGRTVKDLFRNFSGLTHSAAKGLFLVNLDEDGNFVENIEEHDVPDVIVDAKGNISITRLDEEAFIRRLGEKERLVNKLVESHRALEKVIAMQSTQGTIKDLGEELATNRANTLDAKLRKQLQSISGIIKSYDELQKESILSASSQKIAEERLDNLEAVRDKLFAKVEKWFPQEDKEIAKDEIKETVEWLMSELKRLNPDKNKPMTAPTAIPSMPQKGGKKVA